MLVTVHHRAQGRDACVPTLEAGGSHLLFLHDEKGSLYCCPTVICTAAKENWKNWTRSPKEKPERRFSRHPDLNPCPIYSLPDCLHIPYLCFSFPIKDKCNVYFCKECNAIIRLRKQLTECWRVLLKNLILKCFIYSLGTLVLFTMSLCYKCF